LNNTGQTGGASDTDIDAPEAWNLTTGTADAVLAVIDTGVDYTHPDLASNMLRNTADCNTNGIDDDNNGYIDDCFGIDTVNSDSDPMDDEGHGTHVAGIIGAVGNNTLGVTGVNWSSSMLACKFLGADGYGDTAGAIACLDYIAIMKDRGVNIVASNNSWSGGAYSQALRDAIDAQRQRGILFVAAAGNDSYDNDTLQSYPCSYYLPNIICVASTDANDKLSLFSNYGKQIVHLGAPGEGILSTVPSGFGSYDSFSGTSMATPYVTGVAGLVHALYPDSDWRSVKNLILAGGDVKSSLAKTVTERLNAFDAT
jgi:subtilisin family serine protease